MAFFLLMWLLTSTNKGTLEGIARYFNRPITDLVSHGPATDQTNPKESIDVDKEKAKVKTEEQKQLEDLKAKIEQTISQSKSLQAFKNQIKLDITTEGLKIQIIDDKDRPMFDVGGSVLKDYTKVILDQIAKTLNGINDPISIAGHTDNLTYSGGEKGYSNWDLSSDRANAARREMISAGLKENKIMQIRGLADAIPLYKNDPANPGNRRIDIVVQNKASVDRFHAEGEQGAITVGADKPLNIPANPPAANPPAANPAPTKK
jgi:chemotaxis protein MotB